MAISLSDREFRIGLYASAIAGVVSRFACHPIDTIKARLQVGSFSIRNDLVSILYPSNLLRLYRGIGVVTIGGAPATMLYLSSYDFFKKALSGGTTSQESFSVYFASGLLAETISCLLFVPVDVIKERMQVIDATIVKNNKDKFANFNLYKNSLEATTRILREEGFGGIYRGYGATLLSFGPFSALYFTLYENFKAYSEKINLAKYGERHMGSTDHLINAALAGGIASYVTNPLDLAKLRLQVQRFTKATPASTGNVQVATRLSTESEVASTTYGMLKHLIKTDGFLSLFRGGFTRAFFHAPNTAITMTVYEKLKEALR